jgi:hypothetical protein
MPEMPQYQNEEPILEKTPIKSSAEGYEAFAQTFGAIAGVAEKETEKLAEDQSQTMYINSVADAEHLKNQYEIQMLQNPNQAAHIANNMQQSLETLKQSAVVNKVDRNKLNAYLQNTADDVTKKGIEVQTQQSQLTAAFKHYENWPTKLNAYQQALITGDDKLSKQLQDAMVAELQGLVMTRAITPHMAASSLELMQGMPEVAHDHMIVYGKGRAADYHAVTNNPLSKNTTDNVNAPTNVSTGMLIDYYNTDHSFRGAIADVQQGMLPNPMVFDKLPADERQQIIQAINGVRQAQGLINSGASFPQLKAYSDEINQLGSSSVRSYAQNATKIYLDSYMSKLQNGDLLQVMGGTPQGGAIIQNFTKKNAAIEAMQQEELQGKNNSTQIAAINQKYTKMYFDNKNEFVNSARSYCSGHHIPSEYCQPIPKLEIQTAENGFNKDQDPSQTLSILGQYNKANQIYVANGMTNPDHQIILQTIAHGADNIKPHDKLELIAANQTGRSYHDLIQENASTKDSSLKKQIEQNLKDQLQLIQTGYDFQNAQTLKNSMVNSALNLTKFYAYKNGDLTLKNATNYINQATGIFKTGFKAISNTNYLVNAENLPENLTKADLDILANYTIEQGYQRLSNNKIKEVSEKNITSPFSEFGIGQKAEQLGSLASVLRDYNISRNPLRMIITADHHIAAVDMDGNVQFSRPYTSNLMSLARYRYEQLQKINKLDIEKTKEQEQSYTESIGR